MRSTETWSGLLTPLLLTPLLLAVGCTVPDPSFMGAESTAGAGTRQTTEPVPTVGSSGPGSSASESSSSVDTTGDGAASTRVREGLVAEYTFDDNELDVVRDVAGVDPAVDLIIADPTRTAWSPGGLTLLEPTALEENGESARVAQACLAMSSITIEAWVAPASTRGVVEARIVTQSRGTSIRNWSLGQTGTDYWFRIRTTETTANGGDYLHFPGAATQLQHVAVSRDDEGVVRMYIDGDKVEQAFRVGSLEGWRDDFVFGIGNEMGLTAGEDRSWLGRLELVAVYARALDDDEIRTNYDAGP